MIEWIKMVFHPHVWKVFRTGQLTTDGVPNGGYYHDMQCQVCGKLKRKRLGG